MPDLTLTLATLKGTAQGLRDARALVEKAAMICRSTMERAVSDLAVLQTTTAQDTAMVIESLQGVDSVGTYSSVDQLLRLERFAGKGASVDFIKLNPTCTELEAENSWTIAAEAATGMPLMVPVGNYAALYRANLVKAGLCPDATWESQRAWIIATDRAVIMGA